MDGQMDEQRTQINGQIDFCSSYDKIIISYSQVADLEVNIESLEAERDFYFEKLRKIEMICQENDGLPLVPDILSIMYETQVGEVSTKVEINM